jgi:hypothetical protein
LKIDISTVEPPANVDHLPTSPSRTKTPPVDEHQQEAKSPEHTKFSLAKELREPAIEHLYTAGSLGGTLPWGDQQIPKLVYEVVNIQEISYDMKRKVVMRREIKKRYITLE